MEHPEDQTKMRVFVRFPNQRAEIVGRMVAAPDLQAICQDYEDCARALEHWSKAADAPSERVAEYTRLLDELEDENGLATVWRRNKTFLQETMKIASHHEAPKGKTRVRNMSTSSRIL